MVDNLQLLGFSPHGEGKFNYILNFHGFNKIQISIHNSFWIFEQNYLSLNHLKTEKLGNKNKKFKNLNFQRNFANNFSMLWYQQTQPVVLYTINSIYINVKKK